ncbi:MAG: hypothetical protein ACTSQP_02530 [Promethearchaeota archaeon]
MNYTRNELLSAEATMNQMRNAITHLIRFMRKNKVDNVIERLRRMGKNIGSTFVNYWKPTDNITQKNIKDVLATIYQYIFSSSVAIELDSSQNLIFIRDYKCPMCKYQFEDIKEAGCEIIIAMVAEMVSKISEISNNKDALFLEPVKIQESKAFGHRSCLQVYKYYSRGS